MIFQLISLTMFYFALERGTITMLQVSMQLILFSVYVMTIYCMDKNQRAEEKMLKEL
jgi:Ca2+/Na+ antiporter